MQEYSTPLPPEDSARNLTEMVWDNERDAPRHVVFSRRTPKGWVDVTSAAFADEVRVVAAGLVAAGVQLGDRVALMSKTRYEWAVCDYAIWTAGGVTVPIYETSSAEQVEWIISDSGAVAAIVESDAHAGVVASVRSRLPDLREVWQIDTGDIEKLVTLGKGVERAALDARWQALDRDTLATIIYTS
ncbi:MAG: AMP-binding protein, partial [Mycobacteriales bacterium]